MQFNSFIFIFLFLPAVLAGWWGVYALNRPRLLALFLLTASFVFYGFSGSIYSLLLPASGLFNFTIALRMARETGSGRKALLALAAAFNVGLLVCFKYTDMLIRTGDTLFGMHWPALHIVLPLAISFYTFQQIAYLADVYKGMEPERRPLRYGLFICFFPSLVSGPILRYRQLMPQIDELAARGRKLMPLVAEGLTLFSIGLFKKVVLADGLAPLSDVVFDAAGRGIPPIMPEAWIAMMSYTFQLYFDFSGYTDMALGVARMLGVRLPPNFNAPYRSRSFIDFWRRWHMTLSFFLRDYLYIALGGNRRGTGRTYLNIFITMLLGGLWHGASWTFALWGGLHGVFLILNHAWAGVRERIGRMPPGYGILAGIVTFLGISALWMLFRAPDLSAALHIYKGLIGLNGFHRLPGADGVRPVRFWHSRPALIWNGISAFIVFFLPHTLRLFEDGSVKPANTVLFKNIRFSPHIGWALLSALMFVAALSILQRNSAFLYVQF